MNTDVDIWTLENWKAPFDGNQPFAHVSGDPVLGLIVIAVTTNMPPISAPGKYDHIVGLQFADGSVGKYALTPTHLDNVQGQVWRAGITAYAHQPYVPFFLTAGCPTPQAGSAVIRLARA